jgi:single-stranded-DNA-specific exonuclease
VAGLATEEPLRTVCRETLAEEPGLAAGFPHLVALDPPPQAGGKTLLAGIGDGMVHLAWGLPEIDFALGFWRSELALRPHLVTAYRALREGGQEPRALLGGNGVRPRSAALCGRLVRVLRELGLMSYERVADGEAVLAVTEGPRRALEDSAAYRAYAERLARVERALGRETGRLGHPAARAA